ncbi:MAG TPA: diaminopimelate epimerase [Chloroflexota bacterium]|nr:diaminopimelate epimerase [Chloroflexota bacterium]
MHEFVKSHGLGNDYLILAPSARVPDLTEAAIKLICHRNFGVGSDGILLRTESTKADFGLRIFNPDGSEAEKSGNGVRIFAKYLYDHGFTNSDRFTIDTPGGVVHAELRIVDRRVADITVNMGTATFDPLDSIDVDGQSLEVTSLSVGNPHCVIIVPDLAAVDLYRLGPRIERHPAFPNRTNVQFAQVISRAEVRIRIWERGAGETLASGSSSCAVAAACHRLGLIDREVTITMDGGQLALLLAEDGEIWMTGPVEEVCSGDLSDDLLRRLGTSV